MAATATLSTKDLTAQIDKHQDMLLVDTLPADSFAKEHIPGSVSVPNETPNFAERVTELAGGKDKSVIVYCLDEDCNISKDAAQKLQKAGFSDVEHFAEGLAGWKRSGRRVESSS